MDENGSMIPEVRLSKDIAPSHHVSEFAQSSQATTSNAEV